MITSTCDLGNPLNSSFSRSTPLAFPGFLDNAARRGLICAVDAERKCLIINFERFLLTSGVY